MPASSETLEDACQFAWERLWSHPEVSLQRDAAMRWLVVTAMREAWRAARRERIEGRSLTELGEQPSDPLEVAIAREHSRRLMSRLGGLNPRERHVLVLQAMGLSYAEIAQRTGASLRTVERQIYRARRALRAQGAE